jgi:UDP-N-acetylmuramyl tripeptide synthase
VINVDDEPARALARRTGTAGRQTGWTLWTVSVHGPARLQAQGLRYTAGGLAFDVVEGGPRVPVRSTLVGDYNASNLLVVMGGCARWACRWPSRRRGAAL